MHFFTSSVILVDTDTENDTEMINLLTIKGSVVSWDILFSSVYFGYCCPHYLESETSRAL